VLAESSVNALRLHLGLQDDLRIGLAPPRTHPAQAAQQDHALGDRNLRRQIRRKLPQEQLRLIGVHLHVVVVVQEPLGQVFETGHVSFTTVGVVIQRYPPSKHAGFDHVEG
jgi:hypothetical protein